MDDSYHNPLKDMDCSLNEGENRIDESRDDGRDAIEKVLNCGSHGGERYDIAGRRELQWVYVYIATLKRSFARWGR